MIHFTPNSIASLYVALDTHMEMKAKEARAKYGELNKWLHKQYKKCEKLRMQHREDEIPEELKGLNSERYGKMRKQMMDMMTYPSAYDVIALKYPEFILDMSDGSKLLVRSSHDSIKEIIRKYRIYGNF